MKVWELLEVLDTLDAEDEVRIAGSDRYTPYAYTVRDCLAGTDGKAYLLEGTQVGPVPSDIRAEQEG